MRVFFLQVTKKKFYDTILFVFFRIFLKDADDYDPEIFKNTSLIIIRMAYMAMLQNLKPIKLLFLYIPKA